MMEAAMGGMMEVQAAQLAQQKASSEEVKSFAKQLEQDHTNANNELKQLAATKNVNLPTDMGPKHQAHITRLQALSGDQFDREYSKMMVADHKKDVSLFQRHSTRSMDSDVKGFAAKTLPVLQGHLEKAQQLQTSTRSRKASSSNSGSGASGNMDRQSGSGMGASGSSGSTSGRGNSGSGASGTSGSGSGSSGSSGSGSTSGSGSGSGTSGSGTSGSGSGSSGTSGTGAAKP